MTKRTHGVWKRQGIFVAIVAMIFSLSAPAEEPAEPESEQELVLFVTSGLSGRLTDGQGHTLAELIAEMKRRADEANARGAETLIIDAGRTIAPYFESRFDRGETLLTLLDWAGYEAFLPGPFDLSQGLEVLAEAADKVSFPFLLADDVSETPFADSLLLKKGDLPVEVRSVSPQGERFREDRSQLQIAVAHVAPTGPEEWSWRQWRGGQIPFLIDPSFGDDVVVRRQTANGPAFLIGREVDWLHPWSVAQITVRWRRHNSLVEISSVRLEVFEKGLAPVPDSWIELIEESMARMRRDFFREESPEGIHTRRDLIPFTLASLREATGAEIAFLPKENVRPVDPTYFAQSEYLLEAAARLYSVDQTPILVTLSGADLTKILEEKVAEAVRSGQAVEDEVVIDGLIFSVGDDDGQVVLKEVRVNGRKLFPQDPYRIVTTEGALTPREEHPLLADQEPEAIDFTGLDMRSDVVLPRLNQPQEPFPDWRGKRLWRYGARRLGLSFNDVRTEGTDAYQSVTDSRARAGDTRVMRGEFDLFFDSLQIKKRWENRLSSRFGFLTTDGETKEVDDDIRFESSLVWNKRILFGAGFYTSFLVDSEWKVALDGNGDKKDRQLDVSVASGLEWEWPETTWRVGIMGRHFGHQDGSVKWGLVTDFHYLLAPVEKRPGIEVKALLEGLYHSDEDLVRGDVEFRLLLPIYGGLKLAPTYNEYFYDSSLIDGAAHYRRFALSLIYSLERKRY